MNVPFFINLSGVFFWVALLLLNMLVDFKDYGKYTMGTIIVAAYLFAAFGYLYVLVESCFSSVMGYLKMSFDKANAEQYVRSLLAKKPSVITTAVCWHYETRYRTVTYTDANGNTQTRTETYQERVNTWTGTHVFTFNYWRDISDTSNIPNPQFGEILRVKMSKVISFANDETSQEFTKQTTKFIDDNRHRDVYIDYGTDFLVDGFKEHMMAYDPNQGIPSWMNKYCFFVSTLFCLSWPFRFLMRRRTNKSMYKVLKEISILPLEAVTQQPYTELPPQLNAQQLQHPPPPYNAPPPQHQPQPQYYPPPMSTANNTNYDATDFGGGQHQNMAPNPLPAVSGVSPPPYTEGIQMNDVRFHPQNGLSTGTGYGNHGYVQ